MASLTPHKVLGDPEGAAQSGRELLLWGVKLAGADWACKKHGERNSPFQVNKVDDYLQLLC